MASSAFSLGRNVLYPIHHAISLPVLLLSADFSNRVYDGSSHWTVGTASDG